FKRLLRRRSNQSSRPFSSAGSREGPGLLAPSILSRWRFCDESHSRERQSKLAFHYGGTHRHVASLQVTSNDDTARARRVGNVAGSLGERRGGGVSRSNQWVRTCALHRGRAGAVLAAYSA